MKQIIKIGLAQINPVLGDLSGNAAKIINFIQEADQQGVNLLIFPELAITGYLPQDLLLNRSFIDCNLQCLNKITAACRSSMVVILGFVARENDKLYNAAAVIKSGQLIATRYKTLLPNYDVFDERRYFTPANENLPVPIEIGGHSVRLGVEICEDLWDSNSDIKVTDQLVVQGAELLVNLSASPFEYDKRDRRRQLVLDKVIKLRRPFVLVNIVGGRDELVFDGNSFALDASGTLIGWGGEFKENLAVFELDLVSGQGHRMPWPETQREASIYQALTLGVHDYFYKTGGRQAIIGLSGGIDSALVACIAVSALGSENVLGVFLPSRYTSAASREDSVVLAKNLNIRLIEIPIEKIFQSYLQELKPVFGQTSPDVTEENIQSRIRGNLLMALANKYHAYVLNTGNKTELALGYCTMYGDMCGALAVISDLSKLDVYKVAGYFNETAERLIIPERIFTKIPTAELAPGQVDPFDYTIVSPLVDLIINDQKTPAELIQMGYATDLVNDIFERIKFAEFKRRQAAPGLKITGKAFGLGRRYPIINHFKEKGEKQCE
ncbi:MAG TPA: NAD+ synthase [Candidatus Marinimicrobia bacterium]|nr:NAD+ synthase [Candidatus Neomarinimicrobiota bacterium]HQK10994.1 NAD+ synthase [Candidatus Neomarinimicrobiota bacterium]